MSWINPPAAIRRFTWHQAAQHAAATLLWAALALSAALSGTGAGWAPGLHATLGLAGAGFLLYHLFYLLAIGARHDVAPENVAFLPIGWERRRLRAGPSPSDPTGKFAPEEKGDYLAILAWALPLAATGVLLRWPATMGVGGPAAYAWLRVAHAGFGAALSVHVLVAHVPGRWLRSPGPFRRAILSGSVPLADAEARPGWIAALVSSGALVPVPEAAPSEIQRETVQVRDLLEQGNLHAQAGRYAEACAAFEEALRLFPDYSQARFNLAVARMREGRLDLAAEQFGLFVETDPFNPMAARARALLEKIAAGQGGETP